MHMNWRFENCILLHCLWCWKKIVNRSSKPYMANSFMMRVVRILTWKKRWPSSVENETWIISESFKTNSWFDNVSWKKNFSLVDHPVLNICFFLILLSKLYAVCIVHATCQFCIAVMQPNNFKRKAIDGSNCGIIQTILNLVNELLTQTYPNVPFHVSDLYLEVLLISFRCCYIRKLKLLMSLGSPINRIWTMPK